MNNLKTCSPFFNDILKIDKKMLVLNLDQSLLSLNVRVPTPLMIFCLIKQIVDDHQGRKICFLKYKFPREFEGL